MPEKTREPTERPNGTKIQPGDIGVANEARVSVEVFKRLCDSYGDHLAIFDQNCCYVYVNDKALEVLGKKREELVGNCISEIFPESSGNEFCRHLQLAFKQQRNLSSEFYYPPFERWFANDFYYLGEVVAVVSRDISKEKNFEEKARREQIRSQEILESIREAFVAIGPDGKVTHVNSVACRLMGRRAEDLVGKEILQELPALGGSGFDAAAREAWQTQKPVRMQALGPLSNRWHEMVVYPSRSGVSIFSRDIHDQKLAEQSLRESEETLRLALEAGAIGTWDWDITRDKVQWTPRTYELHGLKPDEFGGTVESFTKLIYPEDRARVEVAIREAIERKTDYQIEFRVVHPDGAIKWLTTSARILFDSEGNPQRLIGATADITERKNAEAQLLSDNQRMTVHAQTLEKLVAERTAYLRQTVESLEGVAYTIAHDLRAPLRALNGYAQILQEDYGSRMDEEGLEYLRNIATSAARMDGLINDLLSYARLSHSKIPFEPVNLDEELGRILRELESEIANRGASIDVNPPLGIVTANRTVLSQLIVNLLTNSLKFVKPNVRPKVEIWSEVHTEPSGRGVIRLFIRDNGIGISKEHQEQIFGLFQRLHDQQTYPGTGLGLAIVRKGIERLGGKVSVESTPGEGSVFTLELAQSMTKEN